MEAPHSVIRFRALDSWRGICALLVAAHHLEAPGFVYWQPLVRNAWLFVDFFFVLSGFVIAHAYGKKLADVREIRAFAIRRFGRLWPLHAAVLAALVAIEFSYLLIGSWQAGGRAAFTADRSFFAVFTNLFLVQSLGIHDFDTWNGPSWSISTEFFTYLIFALVCATAPARAIRTIVCAMLALVAVTILAGFSRYGMRETFHWGIVRCIYGFFCGTFTYEVWKSGVVKRLAGTFAEAVAMLAVVAFITFVPGHAALEYLATPLFCAAVLVFAREAGLVSRALTGASGAALGRWSYSIYMVHTLVVVVLFSSLDVVAHLLRQHWLIHAANGQATLDLGAGNEWMFPVYLCVTVALAALTWRFVELPGQRFFGRFVRL